MVLDEGFKEAVSQATIYLSIILRMILGAVYLILIAFSGESPLTESEFLVSFSLTITWIILFLFLISSYSSFCYEYCEGLSNMIGILFLFIVLGSPVALVLELEKETTEFILFSVMVFFDFLLLIKFCYFILQEKELFGLKQHFTLDEPDCLEIEEFSFYNPPHIRRVES